jgi:hypothetical protein
METLGEVQLRSGKVLVVDTGLLNLWTHDGPPQLPAGVLPREQTEAANRRIDFRMEGPGDGLFLVFRDPDGSGRLVRLRVHLGTEQALRNMEIVNGR